MVNDDRKGHHNLECHFRSVIDDSSFGKGYNMLLYRSIFVLYYKHITILNDNHKWHHNLECHTKNVIDDYRYVKGYNMLIVQASRMIITYDHL